MRSGRARPHPRGLFYPEIRALTLLLVPLAIGAGACKRRSFDAEDPGERGKLPRIATRLEEAYADKPLPPLSEPPSLAERLDKWDDFRSCTVRTYVARKRTFDRAVREGAGAPPGRHASIGEAAVEECAVQSAVVNKDPSLCERLAADFPGPSGETPLAAVRCWDTRARVLGLPDECPVVWTPDDLPARNPECLALAHRDASFCPFASDPPRCRALLGGDAARCAEAAPDCRAAVAYWGGLIPAALGPPRIDLGAAAAPGDKPVFATLVVRFPKSEEPTISVQAPEAACAISWPAGRARAAWTEDTTRFWGGRLSPEAAQIGWREGNPAVKIAFAPAGQSSGARPLRPPDPLAPATLILVWPDPRRFRRCLPGPDTRGELSFDAGSPRPGGFVTGKAEAKGLACSDGATVDVNVQFRLAITDLR